MRLFLCLVLFPWFVSATENLALEFPVTKYKLKNGLTVLLHQDHSVPMISYHTWYRVGSRDEQLGVTGAAHMLEHMMFKGARKYSGKEFERILQENGVNNNAFTSWDYTGFYMNLPSNKLELIMDMEVDRMRFLTLKPEDLKSELEVVKEERRWRIDNNPPSLLRETMLDMLFKVHPYHWPVIGYMKDITEYTTDKLKHFYDTFYIPNNAVLVIAGDIDIEKTKALVEKYYGQLEFKDLPEKKFPQESNLTKAITKKITGEVQNTTVIVAYKGVAAGHADSYALDIAANILGSGSSSRLYKSLVYQKEVASAAGAYNSTNADPGFFVASASMKPGKGSSVAEQVIHQQIDSLRTKKVSEKDLRKAKNQIMKDFVDGLTTIDGKAQSLAVNEIIFGDYRQLFSDLQDYEKVTAADVQRVAKQYLNPQQKVTAILDPKGKLQ